MEQLSIRDWMVIIGAGLIFAVLVDAARRVWRERRAEIRLNAKISRADDTAREEEPFNLLAELPNGGARIVARDDLEPPDSELERDDDAENIEFGYGDSEIPSFSATDEPIPVMPADSKRSAEPVSADTPESTDDNFSDEPFTVGQADDLATDPEPAPASRAGKKPKKDRRQQREDHVADERPETLDWLEELDTRAQAEQEARLPREVEPHVFVLNVVARANEGFSGGDILQILLACDLRFGDMDFFHRHESASGRGPIQFSVANMLNPGVFDIDAMDELRTRGLMFFVTLPGPENMLQAFDYMYETAKTVARNLDGDVLDETRSAITRQSIEHMRQQIRELERRLMLDGNR